MKDRTTLKEGADGTGMYTLTEAVPGDHYTLTRRKDYAWGPGDWQTAQSGLPDKVVLKIVTNETTAANLLTSGQVNVAQVIGPDRQRLEAQSCSRAASRRRWASCGSTRRPASPTADEAVRKALVQALELSQLGQVVSSGSGKPATGLVAPRLSPCPGTRSPEACRRTTWTPPRPPSTPTAGSPAPTVSAPRTARSCRWPCTTRPASARATRPVPSCCSRSGSGLGVDVTLKGITDAEVGTAIVGGQGSWNVVMLPLGVTLPSQLVPFLSGPGAPNGANFSCINNADYTADVTKAASALAGNDGCAKWIAAETSHLPARGPGAVRRLDGPDVRQGRASSSSARAAWSRQSIRMLG